MNDVVSYLTKTEAPTNRPCETIDVRELPPPQPLKNTLERLVETDESTILVQLNDRRPQYLYPKLDERGYQYESFENSDGAVTVIWRN